MPKGDHLIVSRGAYSHHGLDLGDERVMQYGSSAGEANARVEIVHREVSYGNSRVTSWLSNNSRCYTRNKNAESRRKIQKQ